MRHAVEVRLMREDSVLDAPFGGLGDGNQGERVVGVAGLVAAKHGAVAGTDGRLQDVAEDGVQVYNLGQLRRRPGPEQRGASADDGGREASRARVRGRVEGQRVQPEPIAGSAQPVLLRDGEEASRCAVRATPFLAGVHGDPFVGDAADFDDLLE